MMKECCWLVLVLCVVAARGDNTTISEETCDPAGLWSCLLEDWATSTDQPGRHGRVMSLPPTKGYYVTDRIDGPGLMPPPPPHGTHGHPPGPHGPPPGQHGPPPGPGKGHAGSGYHHPPPGYSQQYDEWRATPPPPPEHGKIVNRPPNPYKDQFKPSYPPPSQNQPIPVGQPWAGPGAADRVDAPANPPQKLVSETDLYLLSAIEKLVYRADIMEKRVRKLEETLHYLVLGTDPKPEPCPENWTRVGEECYYLSPEAADWKAASVRCRARRAHLAEPRLARQRQALLAHPAVRDKEFWTGGLNPGLLWIWSHSALPIDTNTTAPASGSNATDATVSGAGRCLSLSTHDETLSLRGVDCSTRLHYICSTNEDKEKLKLSNEIDRAARALSTNDRKSKLLQIDHD